jgi:hypothetical protein
MGLIELGGPEIDGTHGSEVSIPMKVIISVDFGSRVLL